MDLFLDRMTSPIGVLRLVWSRAASHAGLRMLDLRDGDDLEADELLQRALERRYGACRLAPSPAPPEIREPLEAYFAGEVPPSMASPSTPVVRLSSAKSGPRFVKFPPVPPTSYGQLAARIGRPNACRAVGLANGSNPVAIVVPCHRVIGANGALTGYGGGLARKRWLLDHERGGALPWVNLNQESA